MAQNSTSGKRQVNNTKDHKGDNRRTSSQGQKAASGGTTNTNNHGNKKGA